MSQGFDTFIKNDDSKAEHLDSLLKTIAAHEQKTGQKIDANVVTWRGMMTKVSDGFLARDTWSMPKSCAETRQIMAAPFERFDG